MTIKRVTKSVLWVGVTYATPLAARPELIVSPQVIFLIAAGLVMLLSQPDVVLTPSSESKRLDHYSVQAIMVAGLIGYAWPVVEWAHFSSNPKAIDAVTVAGALLMVAGLSFRLWAIQTLGQFFTSSVHIAKGQKVITSGPYRFVRHPSYVGAYVNLLGAALVLHAWIGIWVAAILMAGAYVLRIRAEEDAMVNELGEEYRRYQQTTPALMPGIF